jgi:hypothetical protein
MTEEYLGEGRFFQNGQFLTNCMASQPRWRNSSPYKLYVLKRNTLLKKGLQHFINILNLFHQYSELQGEMLYISLIKFNLLAKYKQNIFYHQDFWALILKAPLPFSTYIISEKPSGMHINHCHFQMKKANHIDPDM